ncbi:hypothetical protein MTO96_027425 [Rhipicephalus appendiculatus]
MLMRYLQTTRRQRHSGISENTSGNILGRAVRQLILNCYIKVRHRKPYPSVAEACDTVADLLGVSSSTVYNVRNDAKATDGVLSTPSRKRPARVGKDRRTTLYDDFTKCALRTCVHSFFRRNEVPTATKIAAQFRASDDVPDLTPWTVRRLLQDIGFRHEKRNRNSLLIERDDIVAWQQSYLRDIAKTKLAG